MEKKINNDWNDILQNEFKQPYFENIKKNYYLSKELAKQVNLRIFPKEEDIYRTFELTPLNKLKIVILSQDPYASICSKTKIPYANGLAFSTQKECKTIPKSLQNIFSELKNDLNIYNTSTDLTYWAKQGILLLNTQLTVIEKNPNSHDFWNKFTDNIIKFISENCENIIFVIWGNNSLKKTKFIDSKKHHIFISSHPSPLSVNKSLKNYNSFFGSKIFSKINNKLKELNKTLIDWNLK